MCHSYRRRRSGAFQRLLKLDYQLTRPSVVGNHWQPPYFWRQAAQVLPETCLLGLRKRSVSDTSPGRKPACQIEIKFVTHRPSIWYRMTKTANQETTEQMTQVSALLCFTNPERFELDSGDTGAQFLREST